jgi:hypothetical protein
MNFEYHSSAELSRRYCGEFTVHHSQDALLVCIDVAVYRYLGLSGLRFISFSIPVDRHQLRFSSLILHLLSPYSPLGFRWPQPLLVISRAPTPERGLPIHQRLGDSISSQPSVSF